MGVRTWGDVCWEMVERCEQTEDGFEPPPVSLVTEFCQRYPEWADDLVDFAATTRTMRLLEVAIGRYRKRHGEERPKQPWDEEMK